MKLKFGLRLIRKMVVLMTRVTYQVTLPAPPSIRA